MNPMNTRVCKGNSENRCMDDAWVNEILESTH